MIHAALGLAKALGRAKLALRQLPALKKNDSQRRAWGAAAVLGVALLLLFPGHAANVPAEDGHH